ncbi:entericidin A/B family lipoprotein [Nitrosovibrio sp. Nv4]|uniref:entericidin A/B family lipoprotein n=1 Tax=Nitrosovibrio sp. Nv4 TaxID=1945880 RepID=UPI003514D4C8
MQQKMSCIFLLQKGIMMRMLTITIAFIAAFGLSACNTMQGLGKDVQSGGEALEKQAK